MAAALPATVAAIVMGNRQDETIKQNAYRYLLAKRAATCEFERNQSEVADDSE